MEYRVLIQGTPNPRALKFVLNVPVKNRGNVTYTTAADTEGNPLAHALFTISQVKEVYFFDNYITVTQDGSADWDELEEQIQKIILDNIAEHNPDFVEPKPATPPPAAPSSPEMKKIDDILNQTVRPALQMDGGDLALISYDNKVLRINYQGACGSCPSATMGTMKAIENLLRDQFDPDIVVELE